MSIDNLLEVAGFVCLVAAAMIVHVALGLAVAGILLVSAAQVRSTGHRDGEVDD